MFNRHATKMLSSYLDHQLSEKEKSKVESHLKSCKACSEELARLKLVSEKIKLWHAPELGTGFDSSVRNDIVAWELERGEVKMKKKTLAILIPSSALAAILVAVFVGNHLGLQERMRLAVHKTVKQYEPYYSTSRDAAGDWSYGRNIASAAKSSAAFEMKGIPKREFGDGLASSYVSRESYVATGAAAGSWDQGLAVQTKTMVAQDYAGPQGGEGTVIVIQPTIPATGEGEKIIRTGTIKLEIENGKETYKKASQICQELGGYLTTSHFYKDNDGREAGTITMRIPKDKFTTVLDQLGALGKVENIGTDSQDVSQEYANLKAQLDAAMVVYNKMLEALQKRQVSIPEAMRLESELTPILKRVEGLKNKIEYLNNAVSFTTVTVNFHEANASVRTLKESGRLIQESMIKTGINTIKFLAAAIPLLVVGAVLLGIMVAIAILIKYWIIRIFKRG